LLDEKPFLDKFLTYLDRCKGSQKEALYLLRLELLEAKSSNSKRRTAGCTPWWRCARRDGCG